MKTQLLKFIFPLLFFCSFEKEARSAVSISVTALPGGLTPNPIIGGQNGIVILGFAVTVSGNASPYTIAQFNFKYVNDAQSLFTNGQLYRANSVSTTTYSPTTGFTQVASSTIPGTTVNIYNTYTQVIGINEVFATGGETKNYFFVVDFTGVNYNINSIQYLINTTTSQYFSYGPGYSNPMNPPTGISGINYTIGRTLDWRAQQPSTDVSDYRNYSTSSNAQAASAITAYDVLRFGVKNSYNPAVLPILNSNLNVYQMVFDGTNAINLTVNSGTTLNIANGIIAQNSAASSIVGPLTGTAPTINVGGISSIASGSSLSLTNLITLANTGTLNQNGTFLVAGAVSNSGTINQTGAGPITFSATLNNTGTISQSAAGTITVTGALTNTGTITSSGTGNYNLAAVTNTSPGTFTLGGGASNTISGAFSNTGTFTPGTGTVTFNGGYTNSSIFNYSAGSIIYNNASTSAAQSVIDNSTGGTLFNKVTFTGANATNGLINLSTTGSGKFSVSSTGLLTLSNGTTKVSTGGILTLKSDASGTGRVAIIPSGSSIIGIATVERFFTGGTDATRGYRLMSSPVNNTGDVPVTAASTFNFQSLKTNLVITGTGGSNNGFDQPSTYTANGPTILFYNTSTSNYSSLSSLTSPAKVGQGFYFYFRGNRNNINNKVIRSGTGNVYATPELNVVGLQTGNLNQQAFDYTLSNAGKGYNMVGNPYPSPISIGTSALTNTTNMVYTFTPGGNSLNVTSISSSPITIGTGQGFIVRSNNTTSKIAFTESLKTGSAAPLLLTVPAGKQEGNIMFKMIQDTANYDLTQLRFSDSYKKTYYDMEDADDLNGNGQTVFLGAMTSDNQLVAIASQPLDKQKTSVYLSVNDNTSGLYTIKRADLSGISSAYDVWLMDHFKKDSLDLRANDTYNFNLDKANSATYGNSRFEVIIRKKNLPPYKLLSFVGNKSTIGVVLDWNTINEYDFTSFDLQKSTDGKNFESIQNLQSASLGSYSFKDINLSKSDVYYRLKQIDIDDNVTYSNIIVISNLSSNGSAFSIYPNPAANFIQYTINQDVSSQMRLSIFNSVGKLMKSGTFNTPTGQQDVTSLMPGTYTIELMDINAKKALISGKFIKL